MTSIAIDIADQQAEALASAARRLGVPPEDLVRALIADLLSNRDAEFSSAVDYVLGKNEELYRRLA